MALPTNVVHQKISGERLQTPLARQPAMNDPQTENYVLNLIWKCVEEAGGNVVVLVDACVIRFDVQEEVRTFLEKTGFPVYSTPMGKTAIDEDYCRYGGVSIYLLWIGYMLTLDFRFISETSRILSSRSALSLRI